MAKPTNRPQDRVTTENATRGDVWALMTGADAERLCDWDYHPDHLIRLVAEVMQTGAAITFGGKQDLSGMGVRILANKKVVMQKYTDNVFDLNEWLEETGAKLQKLREAREGRAAAAATNLPPAAGSDG